jgi:hypothetical protein
LKTLAAPSPSPIVHALGFGGEGPWHERDVVALALISDARSIFGKETVIHLARVIGSATARIAEAVINAIRIDYSVALGTRESD